MYTHRLTRTHTPDGKVILSGPCTVTGKVHHSPPLDPAAVHRYETTSVYAQDAFPELDPAECEFLISGTSPEGWRLTFGEGRIPIDPDRVWHVTMTLEGKHWLTTNEHALGNFLLERYTDDGYVSLSVALADLMGLCEECGIDFDAVSERANKIATNRAINANLPEDYNPFGGED